jgi:hypothetical protein
MESGDDSEIVHPFGFLKGEPFDWFDQEKGTGTFL